MTTGPFQFAVFDADTFDVDDPHVDAKLAPAIATTAPLVGRRIPRGKIAPAVTTTAPLVGRRIPRGKIAPAITFATQPFFRALIWRRKLALATTFVAPLVGRRIPRGKIAPAITIAAPLVGRRIPRGKIAPAITTAVSPHWRILPGVRTWLASVNTSSGVGTGFDLDVFDAAVFDGHLATSGTRFVGRAIRRGLMQIFGNVLLFARGSKLWNTRPEQVEIWTTRPEEVETWNRIGFHLTFDGAAFDTDVFDAGILTDGHEEWAPRVPAASGWGRVNEQGEIWTRVIRHG